MVSRSTLPTRWSFDNRFRNCFGFSFGFGLSRNRSSFGLACCFGCNFGLCLPLRNCSGWLFGHRSFGFFLFLLNGILSCLLNLLLSLTLLLHLFLGGLLL